MKYAAARKHMVDSQVRPNDVTDLRLQGALEQLPREAYVPGDQQALAYAELDIPLFPGRWLLQARDFAKLVHAAGIDAEDVVLDAGCGYGYSAAVLARLAGMVMAIEAEEDVVASAEQRLAPLNADNIVVLQAQPHDGLPDQGPYDVIVVAGGAVETVPEALLAQLKDGGRLACIRRQGQPGKAVLYTRSGDHFGERVLFEATPDGVVGGFAREKAFVF